jgi:outer membrane protein TolC
LGRGRCHQFRHQAGQFHRSEIHTARQHYRDGVADFLSVLDAERTLLDLQEQLVQSETRTATSLVAVYKALGGGAGTPTN